MSEEHAEDKIRNDLDPSQDSLAEQKKIENGVDIEPEADEWIAKPIAYSETETKSQK
ncbi:hypothetical protein J2Z69_001366 [Paenibacillus shirakamiensis]|uniref:Uncharacterized protein n=1 Tax=Paenibacillus shirakamiensis TaxID=1265935 RepID=A0ABS4JF75_9BACL|nr:hypothetical protein [Paenibacillus shirakamiensis]MBP2000347.1 hypothetical protein [Paenibacillus shirakamiensis]